MTDIEALLLDGLTDGQKAAVASTQRRVLVVAGAGSGKTEVMARRVAWWVGVNGVERDRIVAFTFTDRAAKEMKFRIRRWIERITPNAEEISLGGMYVGTIHGYALSKLRELWPNEYHNYDILDEAAKSGLLLRGFHNLLGLQRLGKAMSDDFGKSIGQYQTARLFSLAYDQLHEHGVFDVELSADPVPQTLGAEEAEWCKAAELRTDVGYLPASLSFAASAARYYAYLRCRRFLDFSTSQSEFVRRLSLDSLGLSNHIHPKIHLVVDEVQDINPVQMKIIDLTVGSQGNLTVVGDHRQSIYGFRGAKVDIVARLWEEFTRDDQSQVVDLRENFRSTPRIIRLANEWAESISPLRSMKTPDMNHGNQARTDFHNSHVALVEFEDRADEATWIANAIRLLVPAPETGARHDKRNGEHRGLAFSDIAVLVRSSTDVRTYMLALEAMGIPSVVRAGPDLFSQPEVLFFLAAFAMSGGIAEFFGSSSFPKSLPSRVRRVLDCGPQTETVLSNAAANLRSSGLELSTESEIRVLNTSRAIWERISGSGTPDKETIETFRTNRLRDFLLSNQNVRRVFPQRLFQFLLIEAEIENWDLNDTRGQAALFHLGALSGLVTGIETPGWTSAKDYPWQIIGLLQYGAGDGRTEEQPLLVSPDAVTISTIHGAKGLEFPAVFLADVNARRFPSGLAKRKTELPLDGNIVKQIDIDGLADNDNYDGERRLMYVALTRAERFLFISHSGKQTSRFIKELRELVDKSGGVVTSDAEQVLNGLRYLPKEIERDFRLAITFSDLRYYFECSHDFYLRKVMGFSPTIDQAFGYGRGVHNVLRAIHSDPKKWADLAKDGELLRSEIRHIMDQGLFYLRYTTGEPAENMRQKGAEVISEYVSRYAQELAGLEFEPEKEFETLVEYDDTGDGALISGAIDVIRQDDPPQVTLIDFKSGDPDSDSHKSLDEGLMKLQVALYAIAAKKELEYEPERGLVRYLGAGNGPNELEVPLNHLAVTEAESLVTEAVKDIHNRTFDRGPSDPNGSDLRCKRCDFIGICGLAPATEFKRTHPEGW